MISAFVKYDHVIAGLDPAIQEPLARIKLPWMPGSSPGMTGDGFGNRHKPARRNL